MGKYMLLIVFFTILGCKINDCDDIACFTPPPDFTFELIDKTTGENLFTNETLKSENIQVLNEKGEKISFQFISEKELNVFSLNEIGWDLDPHLYTITVDTSVEFTLELDMEEKSENCCTFFKTETFQISGYTYEQSDSSDIYSIKID